MEDSIEPPSKKLKLEDSNVMSELTQDAKSDTDFTRDVEVEDKFTVDDKYNNFVHPEELEKLREFQVLDEVRSNDEESNDEESDSSDGKSEVPEDEIEKMLEEDLPEDFKGAPKPKVKPYITRQKVVLEEKGVNHFEVLPLDWMMVRHYSGMPVYMHRATRVCTLSKPYFLGKGNTRRHDIPISAIPCLSYRKALEEEEKQKEIDIHIEEQIKSGAWQQNLDKNQTLSHSSSISTGSKTDVNDKVENSSLNNKNVVKCPFLHSKNKENEVISKNNEVIPSPRNYEHTNDTVPNDNSNTAIEYEIQNNEPVTKSLDFKSTVSEGCANVAKSKENVFEMDSNNVCSNILIENTYSIEKSDATIDNIIKTNSVEIQIDEINKSCQEKSLITNQSNDNTETKIIDSQNESNKDKITNYETVDAKVIENDIPIEVNNEDRLTNGDRSEVAKDGSGRGEVPLNWQPVVLPGGAVMPPPRVETVSTSWKTQHLNHEQINNYCKKLFKFKMVNIMHFKCWADRRKYNKARKTLQYPTLPEGTKLITIPANKQPNSESDPGGKAHKRDWVMNMNGRSYLSVFHEYVRRALQKQPVYEFKQLENATTPYQATVFIGGIQYGVGHGSSKRSAKSAAARASIHILIPEMRAELDHQPGNTSPNEQDFSFFDHVGIEDPRITEFCAATCEPSPHAILRTCLLRNFGAGDKHIHTEMKKLEYQKIELTMKVGKHSATVVCKNKKTAKQRASQAILQALHPHVRSWGSLLRLYGSRSVKSCKEKKLEEQQITLLQDAARHNEPNYAVLEKLRHEMKKLRERDEAVVPIGTLLVKDDLPTHSGSNLNNVDL